MEYWNIPLFQQPNTPANNRVYMLHPDCIHLQVNNLQNLISQYQYLSLIYIIPRLTTGFTFHIQIYIHLQVNNLQNLISQYQYLSLIYIIPRLTTGFTFHIQIYIHLQVNNLQNLSLISIVFLSLFQLKIQKNINIIIHKCQKPYSKNWLLSLD